MIHLQENINLSDCTLIFPAVSVGNVGQLAVDLLVTKLKPKKVGMIWHSAIMPLVGGNPYNFDESCITTSGEVYYSEQCKLIIIQIRSPIMQESCNHFVNELVEWIKQNKIIKVVILTGVLDYTSQGHEVGKDALRIIVPTTVSEEFDRLKEITKEQTSIKHVSVVAWNSNETKLHGGGISSSFFTKCNSNGVSAVIVMKFCSEGDNISDAQLICILLNHMLRLVKLNCSWESPPSWNYLYGNSPQPGLY